MVYVDFAQRTSTNILRLPLIENLAADVRPETLIASSEFDANPAYSPDGRRIAFESDRSGPAGNIWVADADGGNPLQLTSFDASAGTPRWSPDGRRIVFDSLKSGSWDLYVIDVDGGVPERLTEERSNDNIGSFSRDERWIYFQSDRGGVPQIWKMPSEGGEAIQVTHGGGTYSEESWDGQHLYFSRSSGAALWRVAPNGGLETEVLRLPDRWAMGAWAVSRSGLHYIAWRWVVPLRRAEFTVNRYEAGSKQITELFTREGSLLPFWLAVSPDEQWLLYSEAQLLRSELRLVENFR